MDNIKIGSRIKNKREELGFTQDYIAKKLQLNKSTIQRYENGTINKIKLPIISALADILNVNPAYLTLKTDIDKIAKVQNSIQNLIPIETKKIPLLGEIACGQPILAEETYEMYVDCDISLKADFALKCKGDSMVNARIHDGDIVFIKKQPTVNNGEIACVVIEEEATLKRVYINEQSISLVAENTKYAPLVYTLQDTVNVHILGKAIAFQSKLN